MLLCTCETNETLEKKTTRITWRFVSKRTYPKTSIIINPTHTAESHSGAKHSTVLFTLKIFSSQETVQLWWRFLNKCLTSWRNSFNFHLSFQHPHYQPAQLTDESRPGNQIRFPSSPSPRQRRKGSRRNYCVLIVHWTTTLDRKKVTNVCSVVNCIIFSQAETIVDSECDSRFTTDGPHCPGLDDISVIN